MCATVPVLASVRRLKTGYLGLFEKKYLLPKHFVRTDMIIYVGCRLIKLLTSRLQNFGVVNSLPVGDFRHPICTQGTVKLNADGQDRATKISLQTKGPRGATYADKGSKPCTTPCQRANNSERKEGAHGKKRREDRHGATSPQRQCRHHPNTPAKQRSL